jgi:uncharacterized delta-60 repeat protein
MARTERKQLVLEGLLGFGLALLAVLLTGALAQARPGNLDRSFGDGGKVRTGFCEGYAAPYSVATDSRARIVVGGQNSWSDGLCVDRYRADGSLDPSFGSGGEVKTDLGAAGGVRAVAIDSQGRIVAAGFARQSGGDRDFAVARYRPDGNLDPSFDNDGTVTTDFGSGNVATAVAIDSQGRTVVLGDDVMLARYRPDGTLDPSFGTGGKVTMDLGPRGAASSVAIDSHDRIVADGSSCASHSGCEFAVARYRPNGRSDDSFSGDGRLTTKFGRSAVANAVAIDSHRRIVAAGATGPNRCCGSDYAVARYRPDGGLDASFSGIGKTTTAFKEPAGAGSVSIDSRGRIVAAGYAWEVARYRRNGCLDRSFSGNGKATTGWGSYAGSAAIDPKDRIVEAGAHGFLVLGRFVGYRRP